MFYFVEIMFTIATDGSVVRENCGTILAESYFNAILRLFKNNDTIILFLECGV